MKEFAVYTALRMGLFVATYAVVIAVWMLVTRGTALPLLAPLVIAIVLSGFASYFLLRGHRERFALVVERRAELATSRFDSARTKEDDGE